MSENKMVNARMSFTEEEGKFRYTHRVHQNIRVIYQKSDASSTPSWQDELHPYLR